MLLAPERTESYAYETERDFLVSAQYSGSASNPRTDTWAYDPAGNRASMNNNTGWTYDNLNRMSASPGMTYTHDILGNRTGRNYIPGATPQQQSANARLYKWDPLNRMLATASPTAGARYVYRADGMRVEKIADVSLSWVEDPEAETAEASGWWDETYSVNKPTTRYFYDGQMAIEEDFENGSTNYVKRYGIGARGIDYIDLTENGTYQGSQFPIYDGHGNMVLTLARNGSSYSTANKRYFEAWGAVDHSAGIQTRNPSQRYCANLGHVEDDESGLTYMRARYYEPGVGRFLSQDSAMQGSNLYIYANNNPVVLSDPSGKWFIIALVALLVLLIVGYCVWSFFNAPSSNPAPLGAPAPSGSGELGAAAEGAPAILRIFFRMREKSIVWDRLINDPEGTNEADTFDHEDSPWQNPELYGDPDRYIPGSKPPGLPEEYR